jgi:hypothetical protein
LGIIEELYEKRKVFNALFKSRVVAISTNKYYYHPDDNFKKIYEKIYVKVNSKLDLQNEEIVMEFGNIYGEIHRTIERFFKSNIPPQEFKCSFGERRFIYYDAKDVLLEDRWNILYEDLLCKAVEREVTSIEVEDEFGKCIDYYFKVEGVYLIS